MVDHRSSDETKRRADRSALFLAASIEAEGVKGPVRIRNLSATGALLEGPVCPPVGMRITLKRQEVEIAGEIVWIDPPRCGMAFHGSVTVSEWIAGTGSKPVFGQARVDKIQAAIRNGDNPPTFPISRPDSGEKHGSLDDKIARALADVQRLLNDVSAELIRDPSIVQRHARVLQNFDIADQALGQLARIAASPESERAIGSTKIDELLSRLPRRIDENG